MKKGNLVALLLLLVMALAVGEIYKWADESGKVHYGDAPPPEIDTQTVEIPKGPSQEEVEKEKQRMKELMEQQENISDEDSRIEPHDKPSQKAKTHTVTADNSACLTPISDLIQGASAETFTPITPTSLTKGQQKLLNDLFSKVELRGSWRGSISELECWDPPSSSPFTKIKNFEVRMNADWNVSESRLTLETDITDRHNLIYRFKVGDSLYFNGLKESNITARDENKVEVLTLNQDMVSFFMKTYIAIDRGRYGNRRASRLRGEIRQMEVSGRTLKLRELYFSNSILTGSRTWVLSKD